MMNRHQYAKRAPKELRTGHDGFVYDSKTEMDRFYHLNILQRAGEIRDLRRQECFALEVPGVVRVMAGTKPAVYTPDFCYQEKCAGEWVDVVEDVKGYADEASKLRIRVFEAFYNQPVRIVKKVRGQGWVCG